MGNPAGAPLLTNLFWLEDTETGKRHALRDGFSVGRTAGDLLLADNQVSSRHCVLHLLDGRLELEDVGSRNGTFVEGRKLEPRRRTELRHGTRVEIGAKKFLIVGTSESEAPAEAQARSLEIEPDLGPGAATARTAPASDQPVARTKPVPPTAWKPASQAAAASPTPAKPVAAAMQAQPRSKKLSAALIPFALVGLALGVIFFISGLAILSSGSVVGGAVCALLGGGLVYGSWRLRAQCPVAPAAARPSPWAGGLFPTIVAAAHVAVYVLVGKLAHSSLATPSHEALLATGGMSRETIAHGELWRLFTSIFAHAGWDHLIGNMLGLWYLLRLNGFHANKPLNVLVYLASAVVGNIATLAVLPDGVVAVGASGGVFGLAGLLLSQVYRHGFNSRAAYKRDYFGVLYSMARSLLVGFAMPEVNNVAHLGGLAAGFVLGMLVLQAKAADDEHPRAYPLLGGLLAASLPLCFVVNAVAPHREGPTSSLTAGVNKLAEILCDHPDNFRSCYGVQHEQCVSWAAEAALACVQQVPKPADDEESYGRWGQAVGLCSEATYYHEHQAAFRPEPHCQEILADMRSQWGGKPSREPASAASALADAASIADKLRDAGDYEKAAALYEEILQKEPENLAVRGNRGLLRFFRGEQAAALADFRPVAAGSNTPYPALLLFAARARLGDTAGARQELTSLRGRFEPGKWPTPILQHYLDELSEDAALSAAQTPEQRCEAHFYLGQAQLVRGTRDAARASFGKAAESCPKTFIEYHGAVEELKRWK